MQLILNNQVRGKQLFFELAPAIGITGSVETALVPTIYFAKERTALADPGEIGELIHRGYQKAWDASVQRLVNRHNREMSVALEIELRFIQTICKSVGLSTVGTRLNEVE